MDEMRFYLPNFEYQILHCLYNSKVNIKCSFSHLAFRNVSCLEYLPLLHFLTVHSVVKRQELAPILSVFLCSYDKLSLFICLLKIVEWLYNSKRTNYQEGKYIGLYSKHNPCA